VTSPAPDLAERIRSQLIASGLPPSPASVRAVSQALGVVLGDEAVLAMTRQLCRDLVGLGPLTELADDPSVTDVLVNGPHEVWVDRGHGLESAAVSFPDAAAVLRLAQRLAAAAGRRLDPAAPYVDARLPDGVRLHAVVPPVSERTCLSLRLPARHGFGLADLVAAGSLPGDAESWLRDLVAARVGFLVSGGTGSGKTTVLGALLTLVPPSHRVVVVEDTAELAPDHPHVLRLQARPPNVEGAGTVTVRDLVRQALRMRPDRLVVGEVRGGEVVDLLAALNTGHEGGCGTLHANEPASVPARVEALATAAGLGRGAAHSQFVAGVSVVVHVRRDRRHRWIDELAVVERDADGLARVVPAVRFGTGDPGEPLPGRQRLATLLRPPTPIGPAP
jgi:pilus assembly protein CpaF